MFPAFALAIALNVLQPADTPATRPAPPPISEATPVAVPPVAVPPPEAPEPRRQREHGASTR